MEYLSEQERDKLISFQNDKLMTQAVRKVLLECLYQHGTLDKGKDVDPTKNFAISTAFNQEATDEQIGQNVRAIAEGIRMIETGFEKISRIKAPVKSDIIKINKAL